MRTAAVEPLIGRAAQTLAGDFAGDRVIAGVRRAGWRAVRVGAVADVGLARIDDRRIRETNADVVRRRPELLEVAGLADSGEYVVRLLAVQSVGLEPLFASGNAVSRRGGDDAPASRHQVGNDRLAGERRQRFAVGLVLRAGHDHAGDAGCGRIGHACRLAAVVARGLLVVIGQASFPLVGSIVPARLLVSGWLNMS